MFDSVIQFVFRPLISLFIRIHLAQPPTISFDWNANIVDAIAAVGTILAVGVSVSVAFVEAKRARSAKRETQALQSSQQNEQNRRTASLVSAWVTDEYVPNPSKNAFDRV